MARYVVNINKSYDVKIPYHFTCNYCNEVSQKSFETRVSVKASGSVRQTQSVWETQHNKQVKSSIKDKNKKITSYRKKLVAGKSITNAKLTRLYFDSACEHCGKLQMWNPEKMPADKKSKMGMALTAVGWIGTIIGFLAIFLANIFPFMGVVFGSIFLIIAGAPYHSVISNVSVNVKMMEFGVAFAVGVVCVLIGKSINNKTEALWFKENFINEPNDPDKLPVIGVYEEGTNAGN